MKKLSDTFSCKTFKEQLNTRTRREEIISAVPKDFPTATAALSTLLNPFNVTPKLTQAAFSQKPEKESLIIFTRPQRL